MPKAPLLALLALSLAPAVSTAQPRTSHFEDCQAQTGRNASVVIPASAILILARSRGQLARVQPGDEIAAFTPEGQCAGFTEWDGTSNVLMVWMDDPTTPQKDGFAPGDPIVAHIWDASAGLEFVGFRVKYNPIANTSLTFSKDAIYVVTALIAVVSSLGIREAEAVADWVEAEELSISDPVAATQGLPTEVVLEPSYPNPFRTSARLRYGVPAATKVQLEVFDVRGRRVAVLTDEEQPAGWHEAVLPAAGLSVGSYLVRLRAGPAEVTQRVTLVR